ncbi:MAG: NAD(P) transhydrogenase subunit alpha [Acidimicrobiales bacterium AG-410-I20]|nr:MAG: NAD(P) transhydrogenase subunit alpha [Acidimicrobiales bacterium AG-410-I20]
MRIVVVQEQIENESRVASTPDVVEELVNQGNEVCVQSSAGVLAGFDDEEYVKAGATIAPDVSTAIGEEGIILSINGLLQTDVSSLTSKHVVLGLLDPLWDIEQAEALMKTGATVFSLDLVPRSTRAQSVDVLSSMATVVGFQAVLMAAHRMPKLFPLLITAAGTIPPAKVVVLGAGVAGLQAMAISRRLGATVEGFDIRPEALEQIRSLGAKSIDLPAEEGETPLERDQRIQKGMIPYLAEADLVITAAQIPGAKSPILVTQEMVEAMKPGALLVDLAVQRGGNCALSETDVEVMHQGVTILGPSNLAADMALSASRMFANNLLNLVQLLSDEGQIVINREDEVVDTMLVAEKGEIVNQAIVQKLNAEEPQVTERSES